MMKPDHKYANSQSQNSTNSSKVLHSPHLRRKQYQKQSITSNGQPIPFQKGWQSLNHVPRTSTQIVLNKTQPHPGAIPKQRDNNKNAKSENSTKVKPSGGSSPRQRRIVKKKPTGDSLTKVGHHRNIPDGLSDSTGIVDKTRSVTENLDKSIKAQVSAGKISRKVFRQHKAKRESGKTESSADGSDAASHISSFEGIKEELATKSGEGEIQEVHGSVTTALPSTQSVDPGPQATRTSHVSAHRSGDNSSSCHIRGTSTSPAVAVRHGLPTGNVSRQDINLMGIRQSTEHDSDLLRREDLIQTYPVIERSTLSPLGEQIPNSSVRSVLRNPPGSPEHARILRTRRESSPDTNLNALFREEPVNSVQSQSSSRTPVRQASTQISDSFVNHAPVRDTSSSLLRRTYPGTDSSPLSPRFVSSPVRENVEERHIPLTRGGQSTRLLSRERSSQDYISFRDRQIQRDRERVRGSIINSGVTQENRSTSLFAHPSTPGSSDDSPAERLPLLTLLPSEQRVPRYSLRQTDETPLLGATSRVDTPPPSPTRHSPLSRQDRENVASHLAVMACPLFAPLLFELPPAIMLHMLASARRELGDEFVELLIENIVLSLLAQQMHDVGLTSNGEGRGDRPAPASKEMIENLKKREVTKMMIDEDPKCAICHVEYEMREMLSELPCNHFFHHTCISIWLNKTATCPVCRYKLQSDS